jgi:hypothetical protein
MKWENQELDETGFLVFSLKGPAVQFIISLIFSPSSSRYFDLFPSREFHRPGP